VVGREQRLLDGLDQDVQADLPLALQQPQRAHVDVHRQPSSPSRAVPASSSSSRFSSTSTLPLRTSDNGTRAPPSSTSTRPSPASTTSRRRPVVVPPSASVSRTVRVRARR